MAFIHRELNQKENYSALAVRPYGDQLLHLAPEHFFARSVVPEAQASRSFSSVGKQRVREKSVRS